MSIKKIVIGIIIITITIIFIVVFQYNDRQDNDKQNGGVDTQIPIENITKNPKQYFLLGDLEELRKKAKDTNPGTIGISSADVFNYIKTTANNDIENGPVMPISEPLKPAESKAISDKFWALVTTHSLVYKITLDEKYLNRAKDLIETVIKWKSWDHIKAGTNSLDRDAIMFGLSFSYNWLYDDLSLEERKAIREALIEKGIIPVYEAFKNKTWPFNSPSQNHYLAGVSALGIASLAILYDEPQAEEPLNDAIDGMVQFINTAGGSDGGYAESVNYGYFGLSRLYLFTDSFIDVSGIDLLEYDERDWIKKFNTFMIYSFFPDISSVVLFNDQAPTVVPEQVIRCIKTYAKDDIAKKCQLILSRIKEYNPKSLFGTVNIFLNFNPYQQIGALNDLPNFKTFKDVNQAFYRSDWNNKNSLFIAIKAETHNEEFFPTNIEHSHYDGGQFVIYKNGNEYIADLGYQVGTCWNASTFCDENINEFFVNNMGHNNMTFDGIFQDKLASKITESIGDKDLFYVKTDLKDSYSKINFKEYNREFIFFNDTLLTIDGFDSNEKLNNYSYRLITTKRDKVKGQLSARYNTISINNSSFDIHPYNGNETLYGEILYPSNISLSKEDFIPIEGVRGVEFIEETGQFKNGKNYLINSFSFSKNKIISKDKGDHFLITLEDTKIYLSKDKTIIIDADGIKFEGRVLALTNDKALLAQSKYFSIDGSKLYSSNTYANSIIELK